MFSTRFWKSLTILEYGCPLKLIVGLWPHIGSGNGLLPDGTQPLPGARFTNVFSIAIQIRWKFRFTVTSILIQWSLQNFVHGTTTVLSSHVQKFVAIWWTATELWQGEVSIEFELRAKKTLVERASKPVSTGIHWRPISQDIPRQAIKLAWKLLF